MCDEMCSPALACRYPAQPRYRASAALQLLSSLLLVAAILAFPAGWDAPTLREVELVAVYTYTVQWKVCGPGLDRFSLGSCSLDWAALLAGLAVLDGAVLGCLALGLARPAPRPHPWQHRVPASHLYPPAFLQL